MGSLVGPAFDGAEGASWWSDATLRQIHELLRPDLPVTDMTFFCDAIRRWHTQLIEIADAHAEQWRTTALGSPDHSLRAAYDRAFEIREKLYLLAQDLAEAGDTWSALGEEFVEVRSSVAELYLRYGPGHGPAGGLTDWLLLADPDTRDVPGIDAAEQARALMQRYESSAAQARQQWNQIVDRLVACLDTNPMGVPVADGGTGWMDASNPVPADETETVRLAPMHYDNAGQDERPGAWAGGRLTNLGTPWQEPESEHQSIFTVDHRVAPPPSLGWHSQSLFDVDQQVAPPVIGEDQ